MSLWTVPDLAPRLIWRHHPQEAQRLVEAGLPLPAYCQLLKLSHAFNVLDARGAVGVTERASCFGAMRGLARAIAGARAPAQPAPPCPHAAVHTPHTKRHQPYYCVYEQLM
jgi:hypothetical protein